MPPKAEPHGHPDDVRVHQRVLEHALQGGAAQPQRAPGQQGHHHARQANRPDDLPDHPFSWRQMDQSVANGAQA